MAIIDHLFFPHLIDQIWSHLQHDGLRAARAACKAWMTRADLAMSKHVVIERKDSSTFEARVRCLEHPHQTICITDEARDCLKADRGSHPKECVFCKCTHGKGAVVDAVGYHPDTLQDELGLVWYRDVQFRWQFNIYDDPQPTMPIGLPESIESYVFYLDVTESARPEITFDMWDVDRTLVFNLDCYVNPTTTANELPFSIHFWRNSPYGGMMRFIFNNKQPQAQCQPAQKTDTALLVGLLDYYYRMLISVQFIGLERFITDPKKLKTFRGNVFRDYVNHRAASDGNAEPRDFYKKKARSEWRRVEFLTMEEYEKKVGRRQFLIDTVK